jgi:hypothetical protein
MKGQDRGGGRPGLSTSAGGPTAASVLGRGYRGGLSS